jgi:hypothetical protein
MFVFLAYDFNRAGPYLECRDRQARTGDGPTAGQEQKDA